MNDHCTTPRRRGAVSQDQGGRISGPSAYAEPVAAEDIEPGDRLRLDDGRTAEATDIKLGFYYFENYQHGPGVAIGWKSGSTSSGMMFRRGSDLLQRVTSQWWAISARWA
jgi:hypothetical protein